MSQRELQKYALLGHNVSYSLSPLIHNTSALSLGLEASYEILDVDPAQFKNIHDVLIEKNIMGFNVTKPYKEMISSALGVGKLGSFNTGFYHNSEWKLDSTDFKGYERALERNHIKLDQTEHIIFLGNGGAVSALIDGIYEKFPEGHNFHILRRNSDKDNKFSKYISKVSFYDFDPLNLEKICRTHSKAHLVQATSLPQLGNIMDEFSNVIPDSFEGSFYDLVYGFECSLADRFAKLSLPFDDGLAMLIEQARASQEIWWGRSASYDLISEAIKKKFTQGEA